MTLENQAVRGCILVPDTCMPRDARLQLPTRTVSARVTSERDAAAVPFLEAKRPQRQQNPALEPYRAGHFFESEPQNSSQLTGCARVFCFQSAIAFALVEGESSSICFDPRNLPIPLDVPDRDLLTVREPDPDMI